MKNTSSENNILGKFNADAFAFVRNFFKYETGAISIEYIVMVVAAIAFVNWFDDFWQTAISTTAATVSYF